MMGVCHECLIKIDGVENQQGCSVNVKPADVFGAGVGVAFRNRDKDLQEKVNESLSELKNDGTYTTLMNKYFEIDISI